MPWASTKSKRSRAAGELSSRIGTDVSLPTALMNSATANLVETCASTIIGADVTDATAFPSLPFPLTVAPKLLDVTALPAAAAGTGFFKWYSAFIWRTYDSLLAGRAFMPPDIALAAANRICCPDDISSCVPSITGGPV